MKENVVSSAQSDIRAFLHEKWSILKSAFLSSVVLPGSPLGNLSKSRIKKKKYGLSLYFWRKIHSNPAKRRLFLRWRSHYVCDVSPTFPVIHDKKSKPLSLSVASLEGTVRMKCKLPTPSSRRRCMRGFFHSYILFFSYPLFPLYSFIKFFVPPSLFRFHCFKLVRRASQLTGTELGEFLTIAFTDPTSVNMTKYYNVLTSTNMSYLMTEYGHELDLSVVLWVFLRM